MTKKTIIFVDDEVMWSKPFVVELEKSFLVEYRKTVIAGREAVFAHEDAKLLILDVMMPPPTDGLDAETEGGLATGIWLLEQIRKIIILRPLPVLVLTNRIITDVERRLADANIPKHLLEARSKMNTPKFFIPHLVAQLIDRASGK